MDMDAVIELLEFIKLETKIFGSCKDWRNSDYLKKLENKIEKKDENWHNIFLLVQQNWGKNNKKEIKIIGNDIDNIKTSKKQKPQTKQLKFVLDYLESKKDYLSISTLSDNLIKDDNEKLLILYSQEGIIINIYLPFISFSNIFSMYNSKNVNDLFLIFSSLFLEDKNNIRYYTISGSATSIKIHNGFITLFNWVMRTFFSYYKTNLSKLISITKEKKSVIYNDKINDNMNTHIQQKKYYNKNLDLISKEERIFFNEKGKYYFILILVLLSLR